MRKDLGIYRAEHLEHFIVRQLLPQIKRDTLIQET